MTMRWKHVYAVPRILKTERAHLLNLSSNELQHPQLPLLLQSLIEESIRADLFSRYPTYRAALSCVAAHHGVDDAQVLLAAGSDDAIRLVVQAIAGPGGSLVLQMPNYAGWERHANLLGVSVTSVAYGADQPDHFTVRQFAEALGTHRPSVVAISNPNGPTGAWLSQADIANIHTLCRKRKHVLVIDECYRGFDGNDTDVGPDPDDSLIRIRSFSKAYGLAGGRVASIVSSPDTTDYLARFCPEFTVSAPTLAILARVLDRAERFASLRRDVMASHDWLIASVLETNSHWSALPSRGNFVNFRTAGAQEARHVARSLLNRGIRVKVTDGLLGLDGCIRFTLGAQDLLVPLVQALSGISVG